MPEIPRDSTEQLLTDERLFGIALVLLICLVIGAVAACTAVWRWL